MGNSNSSEYKLAIFGAVAGVIFTAIYDWVKEKPILSTLFFVIKWVWNNIFEFEIKFWIIIIVIITILIVRNILRINHKKEPIKPKFLSRLV